MTVSLTQAEARMLETCLTGDGVAVIPTDTVYGLACNPDSESAIGRLYELKGRQPAKPAAVMFYALEVALCALPELGPRARSAMRALLPGPVTLLLPNPRARYPRACNPSGEGAGSLGLRVPLLAGPLAALAGVSVPAMQSSANLSGGPDPRRLSEVPDALREGADLVLDGGELPGVASSVIDLSEYERDGRWRVVRKGPLEESAIATILA